MSATIQAQRTATQLPIEITIDNGGGVTGLACVLAIRDAATNGSYLDFADLTFKTSGWTTRQIAMTEISAALAPGKYVYRLNVAGITNLPDESTTFLGRAYLSAEIQVSGTVTASLDRLIELDHHQRGVERYMRNGRLFSFFDSNNAPVGGAVLGLFGTPENPNSVESSMRAIAAALYTNRYHITGTLAAVETAYSFCEFESDTYGIFYVASASGLSLANSAFKGMTLYGDFQAQAVTLHDCLGLMDNVEIKPGSKGFRFLADTSTRLRSAYLEDVTFEYGGAGNQIDLDASLLTGTMGWDFHNARGRVQIVNFTNAGSTFRLHGFFGEVTIASSCTAGTLEISGAGRIINNGGMTIDNRGFLEVDNVTEIHRYLGLEVGAPVVHTPAAITTTGISQSIVTVGSQVTKSRS